MLASNNAVEKLLCMVLIWYLNIPTAFRTSEGCDTQKATHSLKRIENCGCSANRASTLQARNSGVCMQDGQRMEQNVEVCGGSPMDNSNIAP